MGPGAHPWFDPDVLVGARIHGYELAKLLGQGGFGAVYLTAAPGGEKRAIKVLHPPRSTGDEDRKLWDSRATHFLREAQAASRFNHPNIIKVYDTGEVHWRFTGSFGTSAGRDADQVYPLVYYVAEFIDDGVAERLRDGKLFSTAEAVRVASQVCDALQALHRATPQILHRDLNPGNIRLAEGGRVVVTDFGVARIEGLPGAYVTQEGPMVHRGISAPEQFEGTEPDVRTDIYQCGALLMVMLTGKYPRQGDPRTLLSARGVASTLTQTILRCLDPDRDMRFREAVALKAALLQRVDSASRAAMVPRIEFAWRLPLEMACWSGRMTPVIEIEGKCIVWDSETVYGVEPETGSTLWEWPAQGSILQGVHGQAVQSLGPRTYASHLGRLSCLDANGGELWTYEHGSRQPVVYMAAPDAIVLGSCIDRGGVPIGPTALNPANGDTLWNLDANTYHIDELAAAGQTMIVLESIGILASGGIRLRSINLLNGELQGSYEFDAPRAALLNQPIVLADGSIVIWLADAIAGAYPYAMCLDRWLAPRWAGSMEVTPDPGFCDTWVVASEGTLFVAASRHETGTRREAWISAFDLGSGQSLWQRQCPPDAISTHLVPSTEDGVAFAVSTPDAPSKWQLLAMGLPSGQELSRGPERQGVRGLVLPPAVTRTHAYVQVATRPIRSEARRSRSIGEGAVEAFRWR